MKQNLRKWIGLVKKKTLIFVANLLRPHDRGHSVWSSTVFGVLFRKQNPLYY